MKKIIVLFGILFILSLSAPVFANDFSYLENLTPVQKEQLTRIYQSYKQENNSLDMQIMSYKNKMAQLENKSDKTIEQVNLLKSAYERNIAALTSRQNQLKTKTEDLYKGVMTPEQYKQHQAQQLQTENAFSDFLRK